MRSGELYAMNVPIVTNFDKSGIDKLDAAAHPQNKPLARLVFLP